MSLDGAIAVAGNHAGWPITPLRTLLSQSKATGNASLPLLGVDIKQGVRRRSADDGRPAPSEDLAAYKLVRAGDVIMNRLGKPHGSVGTSAHEGITSPAYWVLRVDRRVGDPSFIHYLLRSGHLIAEYNRLGKYMPPNQFDISWSSFRDIEVPLPSLEEQRHIADFLDAETSRIDRMIGLQLEVVRRLDERDRAFLDQHIDELIQKNGVLPLRRALLRVEQGSSPLCDNIAAGDSEWGVLKVSAVKAGRFWADENKRLPNYLTPERRYEIRDGDLLITRANTPALVGSVAVAIRPRRRLLLCDKIFRVELESAFGKDFVALVARGSRIRDLCAATSHGTSQSMANLKIEEIKEWPIPAVDGSEQRSLVERLNKVHAATERLRSRINRQLELLAERRQALITAAVTGRLDVTTARSGVRVG